MITNNTTPGRIRKPLSPIFSPRSFFQRAERAFLEDDGIDEIHCEWIGSGKWLANCPKDKHFHLFEL